MKSKEGSNLPAKLAAPAVRALADAGITRLEQLAKLKETDLRRMHGVGPNAIEMLRRALEEHGLSFHV